MSDLLDFQRCKAEVESAKNLYNYAAIKLEIERIKCRLSEIKSQSEPLDSLLKEPLTRNQLYSIAFYVVVGRFPEK